MPACLPACLPGPQESELQALAHRPLTENYHHYGVSLHDWRASRVLPSFFSLLTTSVDRKGQEFASSIEARDLPIYAVQWHPERSLFEWGPHEDINRSLEARGVMQRLGDFLVEESKRSGHAFRSAEEEAAALIWNYSPVYTGKNGATPQVREGQG